MKYVSEKHVQIGQLLIVVALWYNIQEAPMNKPLVFKFNYVLILTYHIKYFHKWNTYYNSYIGTRK